MYRTHNCGQLRIADVNLKVVLSGWVFRIRNFGSMTFIDLRDRYGITQLVFDEKQNNTIYKQTEEIGREYVISVSGVVKERSNKNPQIPTGDIEIAIEILTILSCSEVPPFTLENETDGGEELRMKYRYLDLRRDEMKNNILLRHQVAQEIRTYLNNQDFLEIETPFLIKSTPEGARDFIVPSRINQGDFYALPQSPQTFKQLLMVSGFDKYYQIVRCFRDEDLRADRQPEFTQIDCEMSFVNRDDVLNMFEGLVKHIFKTIKNIDINEITKITYDEAISEYGSDKPDLRFGMKIHNLTSLTKKSDFVVFNQAEYIGAIAVNGGSEYTRKQIDVLTDYVKRPQIGASGLIWAKWQNDDTFKSSVDKFFGQEDIQTWFKQMNAEQGDMLLIIASEKIKSSKALGELRLHIADNLGLRNPNQYHISWVVDFPLFEWDNEAKRYVAIHHPFTSPVKEDIDLLDANPAQVRANAYDLVINGVEIGGGSLRIFEKKLQNKVFKLLGFSEQEANEQFGFLMNAFTYGAPPHGGIAFGFDRLVAMLGGHNSIRDFIAFPKNNQGRDVMLNAPSNVSQKQLDELGINIHKMKE